MVAEVEEKCLTEVQLNEDETAVIRNKTLTMKAYLEEHNTASKPLQCFSLCILEKFGMFVNEEINEMVVRTTLTEMIKNDKKVEQILQKCKTLKGEDACEKAFNLDYCMMEESGLY